MRGVAANWKNREERRRVLVPARIRTGASWNDACILNISSRGLMVHASSSAPISRGTYVELRRGPYVIVARVIWGEDGRLGLCAQDAVPVEQILTAKQAPALQLSAARPTTERRGRPRSHERSRERSRAIEFASTAIIGAFLSVAAFALVAEAFAKPLAAVQSVLDSK